MDHVHVVPGRPDVLSGDVAPAKGVDEAPVRPEEFLGLATGALGQDHRLPAPEIEAGRGVLVGHRLGEAQGVGERRLLGVELPVARPPEGGAEGGGVDGDDGPQARRPVVVEDDLLVVLTRHPPEDIHGVIVVDPFLDPRGVQGGVAAARSAAEGDKLRIPLGSWNAP